MRVVTLWAGCLALWLGVSVSPARLLGAITVYTTFADWENAVGAPNVQTEDFATAPPGKNGLDEGTDADVGLFNLRYETADNSNLTGMFLNGDDDRLEMFYDNTSPNNLTLLEFRFDSPILAFGADWTSVDDFSNLTLTVVGTSDSVNLSQEISPNVDGFVGFTSDAAFSAVAFSADTNESLDVTSVFISEQVDHAAMAVPEPSTLVMWSALCAGLYFIGRFRSRICEGARCGAWR